MLFQELKAVNRNSAILLSTLILPPAAMVPVLFLWRDVKWVAVESYYAIEILGSFIALLIAVFILARYKNAPGVLYFCGGLLAMGIIDGFLVLAAGQSNLCLWLNAGAGAIGSLYFYIYLYVQKRFSENERSNAGAPLTALVLGSAAFAGLLFGIVSIVSAEFLPGIAIDGNFTPAGWLINGLPTVLLLVASGSFFYVYRRRRRPELFLFTGIVIFLFQALETQFFTVPWSLLWWFWQALRLLVYLAALAYVLREHLKTSESLLAEIEEKQHIQEALFKAEQDWRNSFNALDEAMLIIGADYTVERMNQGALRYFGSRTQECVGAKCYQLIRDRIEACPGCPLPAAISEQKPQTAEYYDEKRQKHFQIQLAPIRDSRHRPVKLTYILRDISPEVHAREKEKAMQRELTLTSRLAAIGELAAGIAHEINNPLTSVIGFAQLLGKMDIPEGMKEPVEVIQDGACRTAGIVQKLLTFARQNKPGKEMVNINSLLQSTLDLRAYELRVHNIKVNQALDPALPATMANPGQLQQVFLNIIVNAQHAITAVEKPGEISVQTEYTNGVIRVAITDNGTGIAPDTMQKLFDPFFTTKTDSGGTGLGLSISYGIIQEHLGKILVESQPGEFARFIIELPVVQSPATDNPERKPAPGQITPGPVNAKKILVIDDEPQICRVLYRLLSTTGFQVDTIFDAQTALERLESVNYDLILLDIKMPGMTGIQFCEKLRGINPGLLGRVICVTGDIISRPVQAFLNRTGLPFITKPFLFEDLMDKVKTNLGGTDAEKKSIDC